jgi:hypothetical protein
MGPALDRHCLTAQVAAGAALGMAAQAFLVWVIIGHVMPFFRLELLDTSQRGRLQSTGAGRAGLRGEIVASASSRSRRNRILTSNRTKV